MDRGRERERDRERERKDGMKGVGEIVRWEKDRGRELYKHGYKRKHISCTASPAMSCNIF